MNKTSTQGVLDTAAFYDQLAPSYDVMTGFESRLAREQPMFQRLVKEYDIHSAVDAGAGSGFHALLLAKLGVRVTAVDVSEKMLEQAVRHAYDLNLTIRLVRSTFGDLPQVMHEKVDAVFCLGNSLPHILDDADLQKAIAGFSGVLKPGGVLVTQILNYEKILSQRERIVGVQQKGDVMFVRFYDFVDPLVQFNIMMLHHRADTWEPALQSTLLRPLTRQDLLSPLDAAGFEDAAFYGSMSLEEYAPPQSRDLVLVARTRG
jgi:glycine/sarcosine N-methyltransferase